MEKFRDLKLSKNLMTAIEEAGFEEPTEIQEKTIPLALKGEDILGSSATGSGKTLAFGAAIIEKVKRGYGIQALVLTPTRELAEQVSHNLKIFSKHFGLNITEVYGGVAIGPQIRILENADIVVGTPGRILDHLNRGTIVLGRVKFLVLDETDRMLDMGFIDDVQKIINKCPNERQNFLFSATISQDIERIARRYMNNPVNVEVESYVDPSKLKHVYYDVPPDKKFSLIAHLLKNEKSGLVMVFCNTRRNTDILVKNLRRYEIQAVSIHGGLSQNRRSDIMKAFHSERVLILVCTDIAARGLDIKNVSHVYNYDIPKNNTDYIHRVGRTARAGKEGIAVNLVSPRDYENFRNINKDSSLKITNEELPEIDMLPVSFRSFDSKRRGFSNSGGDNRGRFSRNSHQNRRRSNNNFRSRPHHHR